MSTRTIGKTFWIFLLLLGIAFFSANPTYGAVHSTVFNIKNFGAVGDGETLNTMAIQAAIDSCAKSGGGTVYFPAGTYLSGTIFFKSHITLFLDAGAVLLGSTNLNDYPVTIQSFRSYTDNYTDKSLIYAEKVNDIAIMGRGIIDGQGSSFSGPYKVRPYLIRIIECKNVTVRDVTIRNSPMWVQHYLACENVTIDGITVHSKVNKNNDGIDIDSCNKVTISNCEINSGDDAIVLKATSHLPCRNVTVTNCVLSTNCNALKLGTESNGGFQNITISNCTIYDTRLCGIALELVDGGHFDRVNVSNIVMDNVNGGIFIRLGNRARPYKKEMSKPDIGTLKNVMISNIQATGCDSIGCSITGLPDHPVENVTLENIRITFKGGGTLAQAHVAVPENETRYPEYKMFGTLPAYGFYCRHVKNLRMNHIDLGYLKEDNRPALICNDVKGLKLYDFRAMSSAGEGDLIWLKNVENVSICQSSPSNPTKTFLHLSGSKTNHISLINNDFSQVERVIDRDEGVSKKVVFQQGNRKK